jgi:AraC-like DNA-binding protein
VGLTPKQFARVRRFRTVLRRTRRESSQQPHQRVNWALLAADCGYYDQAHLIKDFQAFAGVCPNAYLRARSEHSPSILLQAD